MSEIRSIKPFQIGVAGAIGGVVVISLAALVAGVALKNPKVKALFGAVFDQKSAAPNSPLLVRGGAMTVFTTNGWKGAASPYCTTVDDATVVDVNGALVGSVTVPWTMKLNGHLPEDTTTGHRGDKSGNGIELDAAAAPCAGDAAGNSVTVKPFGTQGNFYPKDLLNVGGKTGNKRFWDESQECMSLPDASGGGDRDLCERMGEVDLNWSGGSGTYYIYTCPDGDCWVGVGN